MIDSKEAVVAAMDNRQIEVIMRAFAPQGTLLAGRVILVTGAGSGIGRAVALACAKQGATILLLGKTLAKLEAVYDEIVAAGGAEPAILPLDLSRAKHSEYEQMIRVVSSEIGRLDGIVHNAAMLGPLTPLHMYDPVLWEQVLQANLTAPYLLTLTCMPLLKVAADASIVFTSSSVGRQARAFWGAYAVSKHGIEAVSKLFADENANVATIRFNAVNPGATRTNMRAQAYPGENPDNLPLPETLAAQYVFLLSAESAGISGRSLNLQG